jgi:hypothetical protein
MVLTRRLFLIGTAASGGAVAFAAIQPRRDSAPQPSSTRQSRTVSVSHFGARGDGLSDDRPAIQAAIDSISRAGGGTILFPAGTFLVSRTMPTAVAVTLRSGVILEGQGDSTIIKLKDGSGGHTINLTRERNCGLRNLVIDGNRTRQPSTGHAVRSGGVAGLTLQNLTIRNAFHYGIGLEGGSNRDVTIDRVAIHDVGGDGIDIKNRNNDDSTIVISNVSVRRWGLRTDKQTQAGIDCRSSIRLSNIDIAEPVAEDAVGVRMRQGEAGSINGLGGHNSSLESFKVRMGSGRSQIGINAVARSVTIANGSVAGGGRGLFVQGPAFKASEVRVSGCSETGIIIDANARGLDGDDAILSGCTIDGCRENGIEVEADDVQILNCSSRGNGAYGLVIRQSASATRVTGGNFSSNRAGPISNLGQGSRIAALAG